MTAVLDQITLPMLVCAAFSDHGMHTAGSFAAFRRSKSTRKWLYTHRDGKWDVYYSDAVKQRVTSHHEDLARMSTRRI